MTEPTADATTPKGLTPPKLLAGGCLSLVVLLLIAVQLWCADDPRPDDSVMAFREAADRKNVLAEVTKAVSGFKESKSRVVQDALMELESFERCEVPPVLHDSYITPNLVVVETLEPLLAGSWRVPEDEVSMTNTLDHLLNLKNCANMLRYRAWDLARRDKPREALAAAEMILRIGDRLDGDARSLITWLVAVAIKGIGLTTLDEVQRFHPPSRDELPARIALCRRAIGSRAGLAEAFKGEYRMSTGAIDGIASGETAQTDGLGIGKVSGLKVRFLLKPNRTRAILLEAFGEAVRHAEDPSAPLDSFDEAALARGARSFGPNMVGRILVSMLLPACHRTFIKQKSSVATARMRAIAIALHGVEQRNGGLPSSLGVLSLGNYPRAARADPFDGKPLRYLPAKRLLYSVGEDGVDDGGQEPNDLVVPVGPLIKVDKAGQR